jgi:hypothetical protein
MNDSTNTISQQQQQQQQKFFAPVTTQNMRIEKKRKKTTMRVFDVDVDIGDSEGLYTKQFSLLQFVLLCVAQSPQSPSSSFPLVPLPYGRFALSAKQTVVCCATCDDVSQLLLTVTIISFHCSTQMKKEFLLDLSFFPPSNSSCYFVEVGWEPRRKGHRRETLRVTRYWSE